MIKNKYIILALLFNLLNGVTFCFIIYPAIEKRFHASLDGERYEEMALNILSGKGFYLTPSDDPIMSFTDKPTLLRAPLYPYFIFIIYKLFGVQLWILQIIQILLNSATCFLIYSIAKGTYDKKIGNISAFVYAFHPFFLWHIPRFYTEAVFIFLLAGSVYCMMVLAKTLKLKDAVTTGIMLGITNLCRSIMLVFPVFLLLAFMFIKPSHKKEIIQCFLVLIIFMGLTILPWSIRNYILTNQFIPIQYGVGYQFLRGNVIVQTNSLIGENSFQRSLDYAYNWEKTVLKQKEKENGLIFDEQQAIKLFDNLALQNLKEYPIECVKKVVKNLFFFWYIAETPTKSKIIGALQLIVIVSALVGIYFSLRQGIEVNCILMIILYFLLIHAPLVAVGRYAVPIMPYMIIFASFGFVKMYAKLSQEVSSRILERKGF